MKGAAEGSHIKIQRSGIQIQRLEIQIQKVERRSRGGSHIPILASVSIRPTAHTPNYFPHSISLNTNTSTYKKNRQIQIQVRKNLVEAGPVVWNAFAIWERVTSQDESFGEGQIGMHIA